MEKIVGFLNTSDEKKSYLHCYVYFSVGISCKKETSSNNPPPRLHHRLYWIQSAYLVLRRLSEKPKTTVQPAELLVLNLA